MPGETRCGDSSASHLCFVAGSGSSCSSSHPCGRPSTSQAATFNSLGGTVTWGAGNRHRFRIPPSLRFPSGPAQLPVIEKSSVATRSRPACSGALPTPRLESSSVSPRRPSCPRAPLLSFPLLAPQHRTALSRSGNSGTPDLQRPSRSIPPLPGRGDRFRVHSPGRLAVGGGRVSGSAAELLPFRLLLAGAARCLKLVAGGSGTGVATGAPAAEPEAGGREEDSGGCARARKAGAMSGT